VSKYITKNGKIIVAQLECQIFHTTALMILYDILLAFYCLVRLVIIDSYIAPWLNGNL